MHGNGGCDGFVRIVGYGEITMVGIHLVLYSLLGAGIGTQLVKILLLLFTGNKFHWKHILLTGGMPSSHSALVIALMTSIYFLEGPSISFLMSAVLGLIVIRDAFGVRLTAGKEGDILKRLLKKQKMKVSFPNAHGHTPQEVFVGSVLGFVMTFLVFLFF